MTSPLNIATDGYLKFGRNTLFIAVAGYLVLATIPPIIPPTPINTSSGGGGFSRNESSLKQDTQHNISRDDDEVFCIIKIFLQCQK